MKRKIIIALVLTVISMGTYAQKGLLKAAEHHYENLSYSKAISALEAVLQRKGLEQQDKTAAQVMLAKSYYKIKDSQNAEKILRDLVEGGSIDPDVILRYAQVLAANGKYQESQRVYEQFEGLDANDSRGVKFSKLYNDVSVLSKNAKCYNVDYVTINTNAADFSPSFYKDGLVFVSNRKSRMGVRRVFEWNNTPFLDLYYLDDVASLGNGAASLGGAEPTSTTRKRKKESYVGNDQYTAPSANDSKTIGSYAGNNISAGFGYGDNPITESDRFSKSINSKYHEGPTAFFKDGQRVIFTRNNFNNGKARKSSDGINKLKLYIANAGNKGWTDLAELPFNSDEYSTGHPALSPDEQLLFFASDMPGGFGGTDLYVTRLDGESWSPPINLGSKINTKGNEMFPFADEKGNLYFSSNGHPGLGELDIFFVQLDGISPRGRVLNLGTPINSSSDDFGIVTDGIRQDGYFSSNRKRGGNDDDIYKFERQCEIIEGCELILALYDAETKMPLDNVEVIYEDNDGEDIKVTSNEEGLIIIEGLPEGTEFTFKATREGYTSNTVSFSTEGCDNEPSRLEIPMMTPSQEEEMIVNNAETPGTLSKDSLENPLTNTPTGSSTPSSGIISNPASRISESGYTSTNVGTGVTCLVSGRVLSQKSNTPLDGVLVTIRSECDGSTQTAFTDLSGFYQFTVEEGCDYVLIGNKESLASQETRIQKINCNQGGLSSDIFMFGTGDTFQVENIYFDYGKCNIRRDARAGLDKVVTLMREYPDMRIALSAHTDSRSPADFNMKLSEGRAKETAAYIFKRGISKSRITYQGYGESMPINGCVDGVDCSSQEHAKNRRTEIKILQLN